MTTRRQQTASHEAGHAVMHILKGVLFDRVWVDDDGECIVNFSRHIDKWEAYHFADTDHLGAVEGSDVLMDIDITLQQRDDAGIISMAGLAGERVGRKCGSAWRGGRAVVAVKGDLDLVYEYLSWAGMTTVKDTAKDIDRWLRAAHALLTEHRDAHRRVTDLLLERGTLTYAEVVAAVK